MRIILPTKGLSRHPGAVHTVDGAATDASYTLTTGTGDSKQTKTYTADQTKGAGAWNTLDDSVQLTKGEAVTVSLKASATGTVAADSVRLVRDNSADTDNEHRAFAYGYDLNGNLTGINDTSSDTGADEYTMAYNGLNQITSVKEALAGQEKATTSYTYDSLGDPLTVKHPDQSSEYTYDDPRHLLTKVSVDDAHDGDKPAKTTSYTYDLLGRVQEQTKGNGNVVSYDYQPDSAVSHQEENTAGGNLVASHDYTYDANGNQTQDAAKKRSGDDPSTVLSSTIDYSYDPVDRLSEKDKTGHAASTESYVHDANANVVSQVIDSDSTDLTPGDETDFSYDRNRLTSATTNPGASGQDDQTASYRYDAFGRQTSVVADTANTDPKTISRTAYDGFDHVKQAEKLPEKATTDSDLVTTKYTYDPLDRRTSQTTHAGTDSAKITDYSYLGLSKQVIGDKVAGQLTKTYQYTPWGQRLSQISQTDDSVKNTQAGDTGYYSYNSHSDVETVTGDNGDTKATYGYTAYGQTDKAETTGVDKPDDGSCEPNDPTDPGTPTDPCDPGDPGSDETDQYNAFRFNADRLDPANDTYDMGFRDYDPSLNTFTTRDNYNGALDDLALGTDPYTGSRYAYGAGNPISMVEFDGHRAVNINGDPEPSHSTQVGEYDPDGSQGTFTTHNDPVKPPPASQTDMNPTISRESDGFDFHEFSVKLTNRVGDDLVGTLDLVNDVIVANDRCEFHNDCTRMDYYTDDTVNFDFKHGLTGSGFLFDTIQGSIDSAKDVYSEARHGDNESAAAGVGALGIELLLTKREGGAADNVKPPRDALGRFTSDAGGDSAVAATGRSAHESYIHTLGGGDYVFNRSPFRGSGIRPDAFSISRREIRELKPNTASGISTGNRQLAEYKRIFEDYYGGTWTTYLDTYQP